MEPPVNRAVPPAAGGRCMAFALLGLYACSGAGDEAGEPPTIAREIRGDTTFVTVPGSMMPEPVEIGEVEILWASEELERPGVMTVREGTLVVGDRARVHRIDVATGVVRSFGRDGEGPGEFGWITGLGWAGDTLIVLDAMRGRFTWFGADGAVLRTRPFRQAGRYVNPPRAGARVVALGDRLRFVGRANLDLAQGIERALIDQAVDSSRVVVAWPGSSAWIVSSGVLSPGSAFGGDRLVRLGPDGEVVQGPVGEDCVHRVADPSAPREHAGKEWRITVVCRDRPRLPVHPAMRELVRPEGEGLSPSFVDAVFELARDVQFPDSIPAWDQLRVGEDGRIWLQRLAETAPMGHPLLLRYLPDLPPRIQWWESHAPDGTPGPALLLPPSFTPLLFDRDRVYGLHETPIGELQVAMARWNVR